MAVLQAEELFACLGRHDVDYVLIGGLAAVLHGSPFPTLRQLLEEIRRR